MPDEHKMQVLVVGAGPVGLWTALLLATRGARVQIVDEEIRTAAQSYALALHPRSLELLDEVGLVQPLLERGHQVDALTFCEGPMRRGQIRFSELGGPFPFLLVVPQSALETLLEERLSRRGVRVLWNHRVSALATEGQSVSIAIDRLTRVSHGYAVATTEWVVDKRIQTQASLVIGADGYRSIVRSAANIEYRGEGSGTPFAVFEFDTDPPPAHEACVAFSMDASSVLWPLPGGRCRWSFELPSAAEVAPPRQKGRLAVPIGSRAFPHLDAEDLRRLIQTRAPWFESRVGDLHWALHVRFERKLASRLGSGRLWLAGDAAHLAGPIGVHSLNMGFREGQRLAAAVTSARSESEMLDALAAYDRDFLSEWQVLMGLEGQPTFTAQTPAWVRDRARQLLPCVPATGQDLARLLRQLGLDTPALQSR